MTYNCLHKYLRHGHAQVQNLASGTQLLPPPLPPFNVVSLHGPCPKHWPTTLKGGGGYLGELVAFLWDEAILTMQEWVLGESVSTILQVIVACHQSSSSSVVRAFDWFMEDHVSFCWDSDVFFVPCLWYMEQSFFDYWQLLTMEFLLLFRHDGHVNYIFSTDSPAIKAEWVTALNTSKLRLGE